MSILNLNGVEYISYGWIKENLNITSHRVKRWRDGRGDAKNTPLGYIKLNNTHYLYKKNDIETLYKLLKNKKENG
jgi:hypothetical protein